MALNVNIHIALKSKKVQLFGEKEPSLKSKDKFQKPLILAFVLIVQHSYTVHTAHFDYFIALFLKFQSTAVISIAEPNLCFRRPSKQHSHIFTRQEKQCKNNVGLCDLSTFFAQVFFFTGRPFQCDFSINCTFLQRFQPTVNADHMTAFQEIVVVSHHSYWQLLCHCICGLNFCLKLF